MLSLPVVSQTTTNTDYNLSAEYNKNNNLRKASLAGVAVFGAGLSAIAMYKFGKKAKQIKNGQGNVVALLDMDLGPHGASLILTF